MSAPLRLAVLAASPVYYQAPLYRRLAADPSLDFTAIFASAAGIKPHDGGYGRPIVWDGDLLGGYVSTFLRRSGKQVPGRFFALRDPEIVRILSSSRFDVLWLQGYNYMTHLLAAATQKLLGGALLLRDDQTLLDRRPIWKRMVKQLGIRALLRGAGGLYLGAENLKWLTHYGLPSSRAYFAPYCVDNESLQKAADQLRPQREQLRGDFGIQPDGGPVVLMVGRMIPKKAPLQLLDAFRRVRSDLRCSLMLVGSGSLEGPIRKQVEEQRIPDVCLTGFLNQSEIWKAYASADVFVLPSSHDETWGVVVNEAMNFGLPVVATDKVGCATDLVVDGETGYVVPANSTEELAARLRLLVASPEQCQRLGNAARDRVKNFSYEAAALSIRIAAHDLTKGRTFERRRS